MLSYHVAARYDCPKKGSVVQVLASSGVESSKQHLAVSVLEPTSRKGDVGSINVLDAEGLVAVQVLSGHESAVEDVCFKAGSPDCLLSCGEDGTIKAWDLRAGSQPTAANLLGGYWGPAQSIAVDERAQFCACAVGSSVQILDLAAGKVACSHEDAHSEAVSQVRFHPHRSNDLISAGDDGLICLLDVARCLQGGKAIEDDAGISLAIGTGEMVRSFSFLSSSADLICSVSTTEAVQLWSLSNALRGGLCTKFEDLRTRPEICVDESGGTIVDALHDSSSGRSYLLASDVSGGLVLFHMNLDSVTSLGPLEAPAGRGHSASVRAAASLGRDGRFVTGGEDGAVLLWSPGEKSKKRRRQ
mmetsp:Transcript_63006/g.150084  ORF Transcript_63006/g.150084 Transcript_63006/m.150084 type:complete len:358 (-) Transcript_63006:82-1155(-)